MILGHRIRLYPNNKQASTLARAAGTARFAWNWGLARWNELYASGERPSWRSLNADMNASKATEFPWMNSAVGKWPACKAIYDLGAAFTEFFRRIRSGERRKGHPRFKKKGRCKEGFYIAGADLRFDSKRVRLPKLGWIRMAEPIRFPGRVVSTRFSHRAGKWFISAQVEIDESSWSYPHRCKTQAAVGVDLGVTRLAIPSRGEPTDAPRALRRYEKRLKRLNRELSRRKKGSARRSKTKLKLGRVHERIANIRNDVTHKLTADLVRSFRRIGIEDLNVSGMVRNRHLAKSVSDAGMREIRRQLEYKAPLAGSLVVVADRWFPSSKTCSACGYIMDKLPLSVREWTCPACGAIHDRDWNASKNLELVAVGYTVQARGAGSSGGAFARAVKLPSTKRESSGRRPKAATA